MADVPYNPTQTTLPQTQAPDDMQRVQASPAAFGGAIAQGVEKLGQGAEQATHFYQQVQTDGALNNTLSAGLDVVKQFQTKMGGDADGNAQAEAQKQLQQVLDQGRNGLSSDAQRLQFDQQARMYFNRFLAPQIDNHAIAQNRVVAKGTNDALADNGHQIISMNPADDDSVGMGANLIFQGRYKEAQFTYGHQPPKEIFDQIQSQAAIEATETRLLALVPQNPILAKSVLDKNQTLLAKAPNYDQLSAHVNAAYNSHIASPIADQMLAHLGVTQTPQGPTLAPRKFGTADVEQLLPIIKLQEYDGVPGQAKTSAVGAVGDNQIRPGTFDQYTRFGEKLDIHNSDDQDTISKRIIEDGLRASGGDPQGAAVAYFSGIGNVAPPGSPTPWKRDLVDPTSGLSVSQYVAQVSAKAAKAGMLMSKAEVINEVDKNYADNPALAQAIRSRINERFAVANQVQQSAAIAQEEWKNQTAAQFASEIVKSTLPGNTLAPDFYSRVAAAGQQGLPAPSVEGLYRFARQASTDAMSQTAKEYGSGFSDLVSRITLPADNPNRLSSDTQLIDYIGQNPDKLKPQGLTEISKFLKLAHEQPGQAEQISQFVKVAKSTILGPVPGYTNPKSEYQFSSWLNQAMPQIYDGINKGVPLAELMKKDGPLYNSIQSFKVPLADKINDKSTPPAAAVPPAPTFSFNLAPYDISTPDGVAQARAAINDAYAKSAKTPADWDYAYAMHEKLSRGVQAPMSER